MMRGMVFVSAARLWMTVAVRQSAAARIVNNLIRPAEWGSSGRDSRAKWKQPAPVTKW
jgi:hypothetical protein